MTPRLEVWEFKPANWGAHPKSKLLPSRGMAPGCKSFEFEVLGSKNFEFEGLTSWGHLPGWLVKALNFTFWDPKVSNSKLKILGSCPRKLKSSIWKSTHRELKSSGGNHRFWHLGIPGTWPRMLIDMNSKFWDQKNSNWNLLSSWSHVPESCNLDLEVSGNIQVETFCIHEHGPRMLKVLNSRFLDWKTSNWELLTSCDHVPGC